MTTPQLAAWAVQLIEELDSICRSMVPDYMPMDSNDMAALGALKKLAGNSGNDPYPDLRNRVAELERDLRAAETKLYAIREIVQCASTHT